MTDYARTKKALDTCAFCYQEEGPPKAPIVAIGHRAYLSCTQNEELVEGHCIIVPIQHYTSTLDLDDDEWEEIKVSYMASKPVNAADHDLFRCRTL